MVDMKELKKESEFLIDNVGFAVSTRRIITHIANQGDYIEALTAQLNARNDDMAFIKRWVQCVHDKETSLEEFYGILRYYTPLKPIEAAPNQQEEKI